MCSVRNPNSTFNQQQEKLIIANTLSTMTTDYRVTSAPTQRSMATTPLTTAELERSLSKEFSPTGHFLDTATVGLPPMTAILRFSEVIKDWQSGVLHTPDFDRSVKGSINHFANLVGVDPKSCAIVPQVSITSAMVAASLPEGSTVVLAEEDFTSVLFPFLIQRDLGKLKLRIVAFDQLLESLTSEVDLVAVSAVQSADGRVLDLDALSEVATLHGVKTYLDLTQAAGWKRIEANRFDVVSVSAYKWLCSPRGTGFLYASKTSAEWLKPFNAGWYAGDDPWSSIYGAPLRLSNDGRKYNVSPDWFGYYAAEPTLALLDQIGIDSIETHNVYLANLLRSELGLSESNSAIVSLATDVPLEKFLEADIQTSVRAGRTRITFHLYNDIEDVEAAAKVLS